MTYDVIMFNGELDLLEIRLQILDKFVDQFIIVEAPSTFSGRLKPLYYQDNAGRYSQWHNKIKYFVIDENYSSAEIAFAENSPNTIGAKHWVHEFLQKESIKKALTHLADDDIVFISDCDEIWNPFQDKPTIIWPKSVYKLHQKMYVYFLNMRTNEDWYGTLVTQYQNIKNTCLNHLRTSGFIKLNEQKDGWHFSSMGGYDEVRRKLMDSYTNESYFTGEIETALSDRWGKMDFMGRDFKFHIEDPGLPINTDKYEKMFNRNPRV